MRSIIESESVIINFGREVDIPEGRHVLLISTDLQARVRAEAAAREAGMGLRAARPDVPADPDDGTVAVVLDLDQIESPAAWVERIGGRARVLGFFSHVQTDTGDEARAAGVEVYPRGRFWLRLSQILTDTP